MVTATKNQTPEPTVPETDPFRQATKVVVKINREAMEILKDK